MSYFSEHAVFALTVFLIAYMGIDIMLVTRLSNIRYTTSPKSLREANLFKKLHAAK